jgi:hypothetical protein
MDEFGAALELYWQGETEGLGEKPVSVPFCPLQSHMECPGREPGCLQWEAGTNRLSYGTAFLKGILYSFSKESEFKIYSLLFRRIAFTLKFVSLGLSALEKCYATRVSRHTGVPPQGFRCAANFYNKLYLYSHVIVRKWQYLFFVIRIRNTHMHTHTHTHTHTRTHTHTHTHTHTGSSTIVLFNMCYVLFSYACIVMGNDL